MVGIPALTAAHAMLTDGGVAGKRVLMAGGAGAVGHYAVQFARLLGARQVITTVSPPAISDSSCAPAHQWLCHGCALMLRFLRAASVASD